MRHAAPGPLPTPVERRSPCQSYTGTGHWHPVEIRDLAQSSDPVEVPGPPSGRAAQWESIRAALEVP